MKLQGRKIYPGNVRGEALVSTLAISFYGGVDPESGIVVERGHELEGRSIAGKVLVFPTGKGSTVGSYTLYRLKAEAKAPLAIVNAECETITAVGCIIAEIPCVDRVDLTRLQTGQVVAVDGEAGEVRILEPANQPPPLCGSEKGTFTEETMRRRLPGLVDRVLAEDGWSAESKRRLEALREEMPDGLLRPILDKGAPDEALWNEWMEPHIGKSWLDAPWFPAETYFFRRILEASGYFQPGPDGGRDPFRSQKREGLNGVRRRLEPICEGLQSISAGNPCETLSRLLHTVIWGNQADLSIWPVGGEQPADHTGDNRIAHLLVDHAAVAAKWITSQPGGLTRVDFLLDNVGLELAYDLLLADALLANDLAESICFHPKIYPTYVSDVTVPDFHEMVDHLRLAEEPNVRRMGLRLGCYQSEKRITLQTENFWISPLVCWEMDEPARDGLRGSSLLISKGDANYRRWVGDRHWPYDAPMEPILAYRPAPLLLLRVLKAEVVAGLKPGQAEAMDQKEPRWLYNGAWGVIQFVP